MKKSLYTETESATIENAILGNEVHERLYSLIKEYADKGYSLREIGGVVNNEVDMMVLELILDRRSKG